MEAVYYIRLELECAVKQTVTIHQSYSLMALVTLEKKNPQQAVGFYF